MAAPRPQLLHSGDADRSTGLMPYQPLRYWKRAHKDEAIDAGAEEVLYSSMTKTDEAAACNVFVVCDGTILTPRSIIKFSLA